MTSLREFTRSLGVSADAIKTDKELYEFMKLYDPQTKKRTGIRVLSNYVINEIDADGNFKTLTELFGILNSFIPRIVSPLSAKDFFHGLRVAVGIKYGVGSAEHIKTIDKMKLDKSVYDKLRSEYNDKVISKNRNKKQVKAEVLNTIVKHIRNLKDTRGKDNVIYNLILLQLSTGSRIGELIYNSNYYDVVRNKRPDEGDDRNEIKQTELLKTKDTRGVIKPLLFIDYPEFKERLSKARNELEQLTSLSKKDMVKFILTRMNTAIKKLFDDKEMSSHDLRKIYTDIAYRLFADKTKISQQAYLADILGHDSDDINTAQSYSVYNVSGLKDLIYKPLPEPEEPEEEKKEPEADDSIPRNSKKRDGRAMERLLLTIQALQDKNINITARVLYDYGYGRRIVQEYLNSRRA